MFMSDLPLFMSDLPCRNFCTREFLYPVQKFLKKFLLHYFFDVYCDFDDVEGGHEFDDAREFLLVC